MRKKKLQVFVSSTFTDLIEERQAAVQAILSCGHIPAGMELFTAGDESQMNVIKQWIEDSDVYLLILGGRYGSIEEKSGLSYTHLEYEYAVKLNKPLFAVVIIEDALDKKVKQVDKSVLELENPQKLKDFRSVVLSKMVKFFDDIKDIKLAIHETMSEFERREGLIGWIRDDQEDVDMGNLAEQMAQLTKENMTLREQLASSNIETYNGLSHGDLIALLQNEPIKDDIRKSDLQQLTSYYKDKPLDMFDFFALKSYSLASNKCYGPTSNMTNLVVAGIVEQTNKADYYRFTNAGRKFYLKLRKEEKIFHENP